MALYLDPPMWPAHGTHFSHLISDASLAELHEFAAGLGIRRRAFDEDHYDLHVDLYQAAVDAGAIEVSGRELIRTLRASGLRVPPQHRRDRINHVLRVRWEQLVADARGVNGSLNNLTARGPLTATSALDAEAGGVPPGPGEDLLARWNEDHRSYHGPAHLLNCLSSLDILADAIGERGPSLEVRLAAWFHDAVYNGVAGRDEDESAALAQGALPGDLGVEVSRLVLLTKEHRTDPGDDDGKLLIDADLAILASDPASYARYVRQVRDEYAHIADDQWRVGRAAVLDHLLGREHFYSSEWAQVHWSESAVRNLTAELDQLRLPDGPPGDPSSQA